MDQERLLTLFFTSSGTSSEPVTVTPRSSRTKLAVLSMSSFGESDGLSRIIVLNGPADAVKMLSDDRGVSEIRQQLGMHERLPPDDLALAGPLISVTREQAT